MGRFIKKGMNIFNNMLPTAYSFALILTFLAFVCAFAFTDHGFFEVIDMWGSGLWKFNNFSMQMVLVLLFGACIANSKVIKPRLESLASLPNSNSTAIILMTFVSIMACYINWGFGLIIAAILSVELINNNRGFNRGLIIASAYSGFLVWHGGLSASISLKLTNPSQSLSDLLEKKAYPLSETIFSSLNFNILFLTIFILMLTNYFLSKLSYKKYNVKAPNSLVVKKEEQMSIFEKSKTPVLFFIVLLGFYLGRQLYSGSNFTLDLMITFFMLLALAFNMSVYKFSISVRESVSNCWGILVQFPLYAAIMNLLTSSGLGGILSDFFISISTKETFLFYTYISSGILNFLVPSGGGQWLIQGPIIMKAASEIGISQTSAALAISWGDAWTNMIQPFWALPIISLVKAELKEFSLYSIAIFIVIGIFQSMFFAFI